MLSLSTSSTNAESIEQKPSMEIRYISYPNIAPSSRPILTGIDTSSPELEFLSGLSTVRFIVFVKEQKCSPDGEVDDKDAESIHISVLYDGKYVATVRTFLADGGEYCKLGRLAVLKEYRGYGFAKRLVEEVEKCVIKEFGMWKVVLHAQKDKESWYMNCGYHTDKSAGEWLEEGMVHVKMVKYIAEVEAIEKPPGLTIGSVPPFDDTLDEDSRKFLNGPAKVRFSVFVGEQGALASTEIDKWDHASIHFSLIVKGEHVAAVRLHEFTDQHGNECWKLGRLCVLRSCRNKHFGKQLVKVVEKYVKRQNKYQKLILDSQADKLEYYKDQGYALDETVDTWTVDRYPGAGKLHYRLFTEVN